MRCVTRVHVRRRRRIRRLVAIVRLFKAEAMVGDLYGSYNESSDEIEPLKVRTRGCVCARETSATLTTICGRSA